MKAQYLALALLAALVAVLMAACGGDEGPPSSVGTQGLIAFGAREADGAERYGLYVVRPDGSDLWKLTSETGVISFPRWSPTGDRIAYVVGGEGQGGHGVLTAYDFATGSSTIVSEGALAGELGPATTWSADGGRLAFVDAAAGGQLRVYDLDRAEFIDSAELSITTADWSPAGDELAVVFSTGEGQETDLYLVDADGQNPRPLLERPGLEGDPRWSPDGQLLAFWGAPSDQPDQRELFVLEPDSGRLIELGPGFAAAWSSDGERLAYSGPPTDREAANRHIFLVAAEGGEPQPLSKAITVDSWPSWSPAGNGLTYLAQVDQETALICVVQLEPEDRDCLDLPDLLPTAPAWSPR